MSLFPVTESVALQIAADTDSTKSGFDPRVYNMVLLATQAVAFWPLWEWYASRLIQFPENRVGLLALTAVLLIAVIDHHQVRRAKLQIPIICLLTYALLQAFVHPLAGCILAAISLGYTMAHFVSNSRRASIAGLMLLALPVIPSLQTYIGYPLRVLIADLAAPLARMGGISEAIREGVGLRWNGGLVLVDEPCSGIRMLWTGYFLAFSMSGLVGLGFTRTVVLGGITLGLVIAGNLMRALGLFTAEVRAPGLINDFNHSFVGIVCFALAGIAIVAAALKLTRTERCR